MSLTGMENGYRCRLSYLSQEAIAKLKAPSSPPSPWLGRIVAASHLIIGEFPAMKQTPDGPVQQDILVHAVSPSDSPAVPRWLGLEGTAA